MKKAITSLLFLAISGCPLSRFAQAQNTAVYVATRTSSLSAATEVITVQMPASTYTIAHMKGVAIYCSAACDFTLERDGTAATATTLTPAAVNNSGPGGTPVAKAYRSSDVGTGTTLSAYTVAAGGVLSLDLSDKYLYASENVTVRFASVTATVKITFQWEER